jgi:hypothetical protein
MVGTVTSKWLHCRKTVIGKAMRRHRQMKPLRPLLLALVMLQTGPKPASAECGLVSDPICSALKWATVVFVADVLEIRPPLPNADGAIATDDVEFRLKIVERIKGLRQNQHEVTAKIDTFEGVHLQAGKRYLIYAVIRPNGKWVTGCSPTRPLGEATEDLGQIRTCQARSK